jgi:NadR type nicotinamide-nucleotide adenylyltransferase
MEKRTEGSGSQLIRVVLTGPECTGKSTLAQQLASHFKTVYVPEYAREYIGNLCRPYNYDDVSHIAEMQRKQVREIADQANGIAFIDTYLIITKVWFQVVFGRCPEWIDEELSRKTIDLYLLCSADIPWTPDQVRENGGEMREKLYMMYKSELEKLGCPYAVITGIGEQRLSNAIQAVNGFTGYLSKQQDH